MLHEGPELTKRSHEPKVALFAHGAPQQPMRDHGEPRGVMGQVYVYG